MEKICYDPLCYEKILRPVLKDGAKREGVNRKPPQLHGKGQIVDPKYSSFMPKGL